MISTRVIAEVCNRNEHPAVDSPRWQLAIGDRNGWRKCKRDEPRPIIGSGNFCVEKTIVENKAALKREQLTEICDAGGPIEPFHLGVRIGTMDLLIKQRSDVDLVTAYPLRPCISP